MDNVAPVRALNRRSTQLLQIGFVVLAVGVFLAIVGLLLVSIPLIPTQHSLFVPYDLFFKFVFFLGLIVVVAGIALAFRAVTRRKENDLALLTGEIMGQSGYFDGRYSFIRNINRPGLGYIDAVLVGPPGALVFRIVDNVGVFANEGGNWLKQNANGEWIPFQINPTKEAVDDIQALRQYLVREKLNEIPVFGIIVFTAEIHDSSVAEKDPVVPISHLSDLVQILGQQYLVKQDRIPQQVVTELRRLLLDD
ncbi:MAG: NERD domain-containing protein [Anaerolineae bacterium]|nr:NERD domain-containing protein [Anaerolineae bacterium]